MPETEPHTHSHSHAHQHAPTGNIAVAFFLNLVFTIIELVGGLYTNSLAILSDALHDLGDSFSLGLSWYLEKRSRQGRDEIYSYGYRRFSLLGALITGAVLISGSILVISEAIPRLLHPEEADGRGMMFLAIVGVAVNGLAVFRLRGEKSMNARVVALHLLEDVLGWIGVLLVGVALIFFDWYILDPILSLIITGYVLYNALKSLRQTLSIFLQATPTGVDMEHIQAKLVAIPGVISTHHVHSWSLDGEHHVFTAHVVVEESATWEDSERIKKQAKGALREMHFFHATIEIEHVNEQCAAEE